MKSELFGKVSWVAAYLLHGRSFLSAEHFRMFFVPEHLTEVTLGVCIDVLKYALV